MRKYQIKCKKCDFFNMKLKFLSYDYEKSIIENESVISKKS